MKNMSKGSRVRVVDNENEESELEMPCFLSGLEWFGGSGVVESEKVGLDTMENCMIQKNF